MNTRCAIPGAALTQAHYLTTRLAPPEYAKHVASFGVRQGSEVLLYIGHADISTVCVMHFNGRTVHQAIEWAGVSAVASECAHALLPLVSVIGLMGATPVLYGCSCHDSVKHMVAEKLGLTYERCAVCGGNEGELLYKFEAETLHV